jgi:hypothetical protein
LSTDPRLSELIGGKKHLLRQSHRTLGAMKMQVRLPCSIAIRLMAGANDGGAKAANAMAA